MYTRFFGLEKRPFVLAPDPEFLYFSKGHDLAFTHLEYGLIHNAGFIALTGEVGAGKTTLLKYLLDKIDPALDVAMIFNTQVDPHSLLEMLAREFGLGGPHALKSDLFRCLHQHFVAQYSAGRRCVVVVDEAQNLSTSAFEELRMLSNLDVGSEMLLQIILVGQPQLRRRLAAPALAQLAQRISVHYHLTPMGREEVQGYIVHRLKVAGKENPERLFQYEAAARIAELSAGVPRVINSICDTCLTYAFADRLETVPRQVVEKVVQDNELLLAGLCARRGTSECSRDGGAVASIHADEDCLDDVPEGLLADCLRRLSSVELRVEEVAAAERSEAYKMLEQLLSREREQSLQNAVRLTELMRAYELKAKELDELKKKPLRYDGEPKRRWRVWGRVF